MNSALLSGLTAVVVSALASSVVYRLASRRAFARGAKAGAAVTLRELRADLDETILKWSAMSEGGDVARALELPGIHAVRRMLDNG